MATKAKLINSLSEERYEVRSARFVAFHADMNEPERPVVRVFDSLGPCHLRELELVRKVSAELQQKKQDEMKKATAEDEKNN